MKKYIVYDIGGSFIKFALMSEETIFKSGKIKTPTESLDKFLEILELIFQSFDEEIEGIAISMPGLIDSKKGYAVHGGSLKYIHDLNIAEKIEKRLHATVRIENDGKSAALGELWKGKLQGIENGVVFVFGTGIGGGIVVNGQLVKGHHLGAGEFSFVRTNGNELLNNDSLLGRKGSVVRLVRTMAKALGENVEEFSGEDMFTSISDGNKKAILLFEEYCQFVAGQFMNLQAILDPEIFVIGGGISMNPVTIVGLNKAIDDLYMRNGITQINGYKPKIVQSELGNDANLYGALYSYLYS